MWTRFKAMNGNVVIEKVASMKQCETPNWKIQLATEQQVMKGHTLRRKIMRRN
jgi:hypothetical protein